MISALKALMAGDDRVAHQLEQAKSFWEDWYAQHGSDTPAQLAAALGKAQIPFEHRAFDGDRVMGKEMMPFTAIAYLYDDRAGFESNAQLAVAMVNAFELSDVSIEVKSYAMRAARMFDVQDFDEALADRLRRRFED